EKGGIINANSTGSPLITGLEIDYGSITNKGLLEATNSGTLTLFDMTINNAGGNITANGLGGSGTTVQLYDVTIQGGTLNTLNGGTLETIGSSTLDGHTASGAINLSSGSTYLTAAGNVTYILGTINNQGTFQLNGGGGFNTYLYTSGNTTLQGGGTITLNTSAAAGGGYAWLYQDGAFTLDNVNNKIQGEGVIYNGSSTIINEVGGTINANSTGGALISGLEIDYGNITNQGLLEATNSGTLILFDNIINNSGANITASGPNATVKLYDVTIQGGTLNNNTGGLMETIGTTVLDGSTQGALTLSSGSTYLTASGYGTEIFGTFNIQGSNFQVNGGGGFNTYLYLIGNTTLQGGGTITLNTTTTGGGGNAFLYQDGAFTLDNVGNTIQGEGDIYNGSSTIINESGGIINANSTGSPLVAYLEIDFGNITNKGLLEATNSGTLILFDNIINNSGGNITASGANATVELYAATIQGGTLNNNTGGLMETLGTTVLDGSTQGALTLSSGSTYTTANSDATAGFGVLNNQGNFQVNGGAGYDTHLYTIGNTTLQGGGTVTLNTSNAAGGGNANLYQDGAYTLTNVNNTIQGEGIIY